MSDERPVPSPGKKGRREDTDQDYGRLLEPDMKKMRLSRSPSVEGSIEQPAEPTTTKLSSKIQQLLAI